MGKDVLIKAPVINANVSVPGIGQDRNLIPGNINIAGPPKGEVDGLHEEGEGTA